MKKVFDDSTMHHARMNDLNILTLCWGNCVFWTLISICYTQTHNSKRHHLEFSGVFWLNNIYVYTYRVVVLHCPTSLCLKARLNRKWNLRKQSAREGLWKNVFKDLLKFTGNHLLRSRHFYKVASGRPATL